MHASGEEKADANSSRELHLSRSLTQCGGVSLCGFTLRVYFWSSVSPRTTSFTTYLTFFTVLSDQAQTRGGAVSDMFRRMNYLGDYHVDFERRRLRCDQALHHTWSTVPISTPCPCKHVRTGRGSSQQATSRPSHDDLTTRSPSTLPLLSRAAACAAQRRQ